MVIESQTFRRSTQTKQTSSTSAGLVKVCTDTDTDTDTDSLVCVLLPTPYMGRARRREKAGNTEIFLRELTWINVQHLSQPIESQNFDHMTACRPIGTQHFGS